MSFDPEKWQCAGCGRFGTLCLKQTGTTILSKVISIGPQRVVHTSEPSIRNNRFGGYVCIVCDMKVADTSDELTRRYLDREDIVTAIRERPLNLEYRYCVYVLESFNLESFAKKRLLEIPLSRLQELYRKVVEL